MVHHINGDVNDNRIENLKIVSRSQHKTEHPEIGFNTRFKKENYISVGVLCDLYLLKKMSVNEIAELLNTSPMTVWRNLKKHGIKTRTKRQAAILKKV